MPGCRATPDRSCRKGLGSLIISRPEIIFTALSVAALLLATIYAAIVSFRPERPEVRPSWFFPERSARWTRIGIGGLTAIGVIVLGVWLAPGMHHASRPPSRYLVPDGYVGWVRVEYGVPGAPPLSMEDGRVVFKFPPEAVLRTSSPERFGWAKDEFFYYREGTLRPLQQSGRGGGGTVWGRINGEAMTASGKRQYEEFFVGSEPQFRQAVNLQENAPAKSAH